MSSEKNDTSIPDTIFISHASSDEKYVKELVNLLVPLHIPNIVCSSLNRYHIPNDVDIYDYLADKLNGTGRVIFVLSKNYYDSAACLNEMGACWILNKNYTTILTPNFDYENIAGAVNPNQMAFKLNNEDRLCEFVEGIKQEFSVKGLPTMEFVELVSQTAKNVSDFAYDEKIQTEKLNWKIESCRNREGKLAVALRIINPTNDKINVDSVVFNFKDADQNVLRVEEPVDLSLRKNENIIFSFDLDYGDSNYNIYNHPVNQNVQLRTYIDAW